MSCWSPYVTFSLNGGFSGTCPCNRTVRPHYPGPYDTGPYDPRPHDHTNIQPYHPGPKFDTSSLQHIFTTDQTSHQYVSKFSLSRRIPCISTELRTKKEIRKPVVVNKTGPSECKQEAERLEDDTRIFFIRNCLQETQLSDRQKNKKLQYWENIT